tara:strand:+ start:1019 stop:1567 length:549 start_codon:yes stop_codon:yes gene_type:complete
MKRGQDFNESVDGIFGGSLDFHGDSMVLRNVTNLDASDTGSRAVSPGDNPSGSLSRAECGYVILGSAIGTAQALGKGFSLALPTPERGLHYKFILRAPSIANNAAAAIKIHSTSNGTAGSPLIIGNVRGHGDDNGANVVAVKGVVTFVHNKATAGDMAEIWSDGTNWFLDAVYDADGSITLT